MRCPLCHGFVSEGEDLQFHYLLGCTAYAANKAPEDAEKDGEKRTAVRFRWAKVSPCVDRIVHLISSLAGSIAMHWSDIENLYESSMTDVPVGKHTCQLAIGGDVVPVQDFEIEDDTDVMYINPIEEAGDIEEDIDTQENLFDVHDNPVAELLASRSYQYQRDKQITPDRELRHTRYDDEDGNNDDIEADLYKDGNHGNPIELSPLYKELLQHQVLHGEPSWIPSSGSQSPTSSDQEIEELIQRAKSEGGGPPLLTGQPANPDDRLLKSPIPVKPIEIVELSEKPGKAGSKTTETKVEKDEGLSSSSSSGTFSGSSSKGSSEHSSKRQSPPPLNSDSSDEDGALQEQSLEESIPQIDELPCPYTRTFLTSDIPDNVLTETVPTDSALTPEDPSDVTVDGNQSGTSASPPNQPVSPVNGQSEIRASPPHLSAAGDQAEGSPYGQLSSSQDRPPSSGTDGHSELRTSPQARPGSASSGQSEPRASPLDQTPISHVRPSSDGTGSQSETRASPYDQPQVDPPASGRSSQSEPRASPHDRPSSARSTQSETRNSPRERPSSARSSQSEPRASPHDRPFSVRSTQSERWTSPHDRPSSARSVQSEPRTSPQHRSLSSEQMERRYSGPIGFSGQSQERLTPPLSDPTPTHTDTQVRVSSGSSHRSRTSPPGELPSPSEPSPSISRHSSARSSLHGAGLLPDRPQNGLPVDLVQPRESHALSHDSERPVELAYQRDRQALPHRSENGLPVDRLPVDRAYPRESHALSLGYRSFHRQPDRSAFTTTSGTGLSHGPYKHQTDRTSTRHQDKGPSAYKDLLIVGHSISGSAGPSVNDEERKRSSPDDRRGMPELFAEEFSKRTAVYEEEIKQLKALNEELCQQLLSVEAAAALTERDIERSNGLDVLVKALNQKLSEKDHVIEELEKRVGDLEKENQAMKDEQESLKTINKLTYEDLNKVNSDLLAERSFDLRRKTYGSPMRSLADDTVPQIEATNHTLRDKVNRLETQKRDLKTKYNDTKVELENTKAEKNISEFRLTRAKSEADLRETFERFTDYKPTTDKDLLGGVTLNRADTSGLGSSRNTWSDTNVDSAYKISSHVTPSHALLNGSSTRDYTRRHNPAGYGTSGAFRGTMGTGLDDITQRPAFSRSRHRSLSSESSGSSLLEYEYGANMRIPNETKPYGSRENKVELRGTGSGRRTRPHSYDGSSKPMSDYQTDLHKHHPKSSSYTTTRQQDYSSTKPYEYTRSSHNSSFTSDSSYGTTPYITTADSIRTKDYSKPIMPISSGDIRLGKRVVVMRTGGNVGRGVVRYVGPLSLRPGTYVGVELDNLEGKHDGSFDGRQYFKCKPNRGIFVKFDKVIMCYN